jgi:hypothetical protein
MKVVAVLRVITPGQVHVVLLQPQARIRQAPHYDHELKSTLTVFVPGVLEVSVDVFTSSEFRFVLVKP